jgi:NAD+ kinase
MTGPPGERFNRIGLLVHPRRELANALAMIRAWAARHDVDVVQIRSPGQHREVAPQGDVADCDLVLALGGDGTTLAALHAAGLRGRPVLGVACGSLGALTAVTAERLDGALDRVAAGDWRSRRLPGLGIARDGGRLTALNDLVLVRCGAGQVMIELVIAGERGSTAYTLAAGGPMLAPGTPGIVLTPLAPHGGVCPPVVTAPGTPVTVLLDPGHSGARVEVDGRVEDEPARFQPATFELSFEPDVATLVSLGDQEPLVAGLRRRRILLDSPRILARDDREAAADDRPPL